MNCVVVAFSVLAKYVITGYSLITLSAMNFERYLSIVKPLVHRTKLTKKKLLSIVLSGCVAHTVIALLSFFIATNMRRPIGGIYVLLFMNATAYFYIRIFLAAKTPLPSETPPNAITDEASTTKKSKNKLREIKLAKTCFTIVLVFVFSFLPVSITMTLTAQQLGAVATLRTVQSWSATIGMMNSSLNSIIFFWTRPILRNEAKKIFFSKI